jgi:soluble lytic murein transglycosylase
MPRRNHWILACLLALESISACRAQDLAEGRVQFMAAYALANDGVTETTTDSDVLRAYPLYPYLQAARIRRALDALLVNSRGGASTNPTAPTIDADAAAAAFLAEHAGEPVGESLRRTWLASLAARKQWNEYLAQYLSDLDGNPVLRCQSLSARAALGRTEGLADAIAQAWLTPESAPEACDGAFDWLRLRDGLTPELIERRGRLALAAGETNLARWLAKQLPESKASSLLQWASLIDAPQAAIDASIANPARPVEAEALLAGWSRLARSDVDAAIARFDALVAVRGIDARAASQYALPIALSLSWSRRPEALAWFARVHEDDFDERAHEWRTRAALWAGDWSAAARAIAAMPETLRTQARWRYWEARATEQLGDRKKARELYEAVIPSDNWFAALSAARLDRKVTPRLEPLALDAQQMDALEKKPAVARARELLYTGQRQLAPAEWRHALERLTPSTAVQAIGLASRWGWHDQAIATAAQQKIFNDYVLLYPRPFDREVYAARELSDLPEELIYAIMRQESLFRSDARSTAGALGLMQMLPTTAARTARKYDRRPPTRAELLIPEINVPLGAGELRWLLDRFDGQLQPAIASYNAGPGAARRWMPAAPMDIDVWVENIPFNETRAYVQRVSWHSIVFAWLRDREPRDASAWTGKIKPLAAPTAGA